MIVSRRFAEAGVARLETLRQTLVGLQEVAPWQHGVQYAAVTMVGAATYRKLARKTSVSYPLLSDPSRAWLGLLAGGAPAAEETSALFSENSWALLSAGKDSVRLVG